MVVFSGLRPKCAVFLKSDSLIEKSPMASAPSEKCVELPYHCAVCGVKLAAEADTLRYDAACRGCRSLLWCRRRTVGDVVVLDVIPGRTPEHGEVVRVAESLVRLGGPPRVVVDLSRFDLISSAFVAALVVLNRATQRAKGKLVLCGMRRFVRDTFVRTKLDTVIEVSDDEKSARARLQSAQLTSPRLAAANGPDPTQSPTSSAGS